MHNTTLGLLCCENTVGASTLHGGEAAVVAVMREDKLAPCELGGQQMLQFLESAHEQSSWASAAESRLTTPCLQASLWPWWLAGT